MSTLHPASETVRAENLMRTDLITLTPASTAREAIETFEEYKIGGAPVVDPAGKILGILTVSDIVRKEHLVEGRLCTERSDYYLANGEEGWLDEDRISMMEGFSPSTAGPDRVTDWMNPNIISVDPTTDIVTVCRLMVKNSIHRVLVIEDGHLCGIVSSFDIVRYMAQGK